MSPDRSSGRTGDRVRQGDRRESGVAGRECDRKASPVRDAEEPGPGRVHQVSGAQERESVAVELHQLLDPTSRGRDAPSDRHPRPQGEMVYR